MADDWKPDLLRVLRKGNAICFAGAGISVQAGLSDWREFLRSLLEEIPDARPDIEAHRRILNARLDKGLYLECADYLKGLAGNSSKFYRLVSAKIESNDGHCDSISALTQLPFRKYITTNWDRTIERAVARTQNIALDVFSNRPNHFTRFCEKRHPAILHLHGVASDPETIVLDSEAYTRFTTNPEYTEPLRLLFTSHPFVFIGVSFDDPPLRLFLEYCRKYIQFVISHKAYAFVLKSQTELIRILNDAQISTIECSSYEQMWKGLKSLKHSSEEIEDILKNAGVAVPSIRETKVRLGVAFSALQLRLQGESISLQTKLVSALILAELCGDVSLKTPELLSKVAKQLVLPERKLELLVNQALEILKGKNAISDVNGLWRQNDKPTLDTISRRLDSIIDRIFELYLLANAKNLTFPKERLKEFLMYAIESNSAAIASQFRGILTPMVDLLDTFLFEDERPHAPDIGEAIRLGLNGLGAEDSRCITELALAAYAYQITFYSPNQNFENLLRGLNTYVVDSSVLLPILSDLTPEAVLNGSLLNDLRTRGFQLVVTDGVLEEILYHRTNASADYDGLKQDDGLFSNSIYIFSGEDRNVFKYAFGFYRQVNPKGRFNEYLRKHVRWTGKLDLIKVLEKHGIKLLSKQIPSEEIKMAVVELGQYLHADDRKLRIPMLLEHDSEMVLLAKKLGNAAAILTYDVKLGRICRQSKYQDVSQRIVHPIHLIEIFEDGRIPLPGCRAFLNYLLPTGDGSLREVAQAHYLTRLLSGDIAIQNKSVTEGLIKIMETLENWAQRQSNVRINDPNFTPEAARQAIDQLELKFIEYSKELERN